MSQTPLTASQGNSHCPGAPTITITAAHRESLKKPEHTTILHKASRTMFSAKPAKRPGSPSGFSWFRQPNFRHGDGTVSQIYCGPKPKPQSYNPTPGGQAIIQSRNPQSSGQEKTQPHYPQTHVQVTQLQSPTRCVDPSDPSSTWTPPTIMAPWPCEPQPAVRANPKPPKLQPVVQADPQSCRPQSSGQSGAKNPQSFDEWMAKFCVEPPEDTYTCCLAFWVPCAIYGKTHWRLKQVEEGRDPSGDSWEPRYGCNGPCWALYGMCFLIQCDCLLTGFQRTRIRATYGIKGNIAKDFALAIFCRPCTMAQNDREVRAREGDMDLRTHPDAPVIADQPSRFQPMRYVSPRATASDRTQNSQQNLQGSCDGADPVGVVPEPKKSDKSKLETAETDNIKSAKAKSGIIRSELPKPNCPQSNTPISEKVKSSKMNVSQQTNVAIIEMSQIKKPHPAGSLKPVGFNGSGPNTRSSSHDASPLRSNKLAQDDMKSLVKTSDPTFSASYSGKMNEVRSKPASSSTHDVADYRPEVPPKGADLKRDGDSSADKKSKAKGTPSQQHASASYSTVKVEESDTSYHNLAECTKVKSTKEEGKSSEHTITDDGTVVHDSSKAKGDAEKKNNSNTTDTHELSYVHDFTDCPVDKNVLEYYEKEEKRSQASQSQARTDCSTTSSLVASSPSQHALSEFPEEGSSRKTKSKSFGLNLHVLADCEHTDDSKATSTGPEPHALVDCTRESISSAPQPTTSEQHALAECRGDGGRQSRRASSAPDSPTDNSLQARQHRLASCPIHSLNQKEEKAAIAHHVAEKAQVNQSGDSQSTVKPSSQHTLSDCMGGAKLELQGAAGDGQMKTDRHGSLSSLRHLIKGNQDAADHPQRSRYRREIEINANLGGTKRTSKAQSALSNVLASSGGKKENSHREHAPVVEGVEDAIHDAGDAVKKQTDKIGDTVKKQTDKLSGKEEHKSGFSSVFSKITSPNTKAQQ